MQSGSLHPILRMNVDSQRRGAFQCAFVAAAATALAVTLALVGVFGLLARRWFAASDSALVLGFFALPPALFFAWVVATRRVPSDRAIVARLDRDAGGTGRLLTRTEISDNRYDQEVVRVLVRAPSIARPNYSSAARIAVPWLVFAVIPFFLAPDRFAREPRALGALEPSFARIDEKLATLEEEVSLEKNGESDLVDRVEKTREAAELAALDGAMESALEALDRLERDLASSAERAAEAMESAAEDAASAAMEPDPNAAAEAFSRVEDDLAAAGLADAMAAAKADLAAMERERTAAEPGEAGEVGEAGEAGESGEAGEPGAAGAALASALANRLAKKAAALSRAGLLKPMDAELAAKLEALAAKLKEARERAERELAELQEIDLCEEEQHGPG